MLNYALPVVDLHRHLDGNIRPSTIWSLVQQHNIDIDASSLKDIERLTQVQDKTSDLLSFIKKLEYGVSALADTEACYRVAYENVEDAVAEKLDYAELRFSPHFMGRAFSLSEEAVTEAVIAGVRDAAKSNPQIKINLIGILSRTFGPQICDRELDAFLAFKDQIVGLDLAGDEINFPAAQFISHFRRGRDAQWHITVHAGEADGPASIWQAIELLGANRIGHGVAAQRDAALVDYLAKHRIGIESCPTSNYQTATVENTAAHPLKQFLEAGVEVTINTDDPGISALTLEHEYQVAREVIGLSKEQLAQIQLNGLSQAFLSADERKSLMSKANQRSEQP